MRRFMFGFMCLAFACAALADDPKTKATEARVAVAEAMKSFAGTWEIVSAKPEGAAKDAWGLVFRTDGTYAAIDCSGKTLWAGTFEIDPAASPMVWDHRSHEGKKNGNDVLGIYELSADKLSVRCVVGKWQGKEWIGRPRPVEMSSKEFDVSIELARVTSGK